MELLLYDVAGGRRYRRGVCPKLLTTLGDGGVLGLLRLSLLVIELVTAS